MNRVRALVEGQTEEAFVREVLAPNLGVHGVFVSATRIGKPGRRGGVRPWPVVRNDILATLKQDRAVYCTTMFDYYGLPSDWPGTDGTRRKKLISTKAGEIQQAIQADVCNELGETFDAQRFIPYIQMHEFEALIFSDTGVLAECLQRPDLQARLNTIVEECGEPEGIDDHPETAPSKRIRALVHGYQKVLHGVIAAKRIGLTTMREKCPHFAQWLGALEGLGEGSG
ncbi:MAG: DUF4276 family protein [Planctomycetota bacterium]